MAQTTLMNAEGYAPLNPLLMMKPAPDSTFSQWLSRIVSGWMRRPLNRASVTTSFTGLRGLPIPAALDGIALLIRVHTLGLHHRLGLTPIHNSPVHHDHLPVLKMYRFA